MQLDNILAVPPAQTAKPAAPPPRDAREETEPFEAEYDRSAPPREETVKASPEPQAPSEPVDQEIRVQVEDVEIDVPVDVLPEAETRPEGEELVSVEVVAPLLPTEPEPSTGANIQKPDGPILSEKAPEIPLPVAPAEKVAEIQPAKPETTIHPLRPLVEAVVNPKQREPRKGEPARLSPEPLSPQAPALAETKALAVPQARREIPQTPEQPPAKVEIPLDRPEPAPRTVERVERTTVEIRAVPQPVVQRTVVAQPIEAPRVEIVEESAPLQQSEPRVREVAQASDLLAKAPDLGRQVVRQIADVARFLVDRPVEVSLSPEELGRVRMTLVQSDTGLSVNIQAERGETLDLIRRHIDELENDFQAAGFADVAFAFGQHAEGEQPQATTEERESSQTAEASSHPVRVPVAHAGGLDLRL